MRRIICAIVLLASLFSFCLPFSAVDETKTKAEIVAEFMDGIHIGSYNVPFIDEEEDVKAIAENGIDLVLLAEDRTDNLEQAIEWCEKYGIYVFLNGVKTWMPDEQIRTALSNDILNSPVVIGHHIFDEPYPEVFEEIHHTLLLYKEVQPDLIPFVNLFPDHDGLPRSYTEYVGQYCEMFDPDYICTDYYPLLITGTRDQYMTHLAEIQRVCLEQDRDTWMYVCGVQHASYRNPTYTDFGFQSYMALAFGATKILNFCYASIYDGYGLGSVDADGNKSEYYDDTQAVNTEIKFAAEMLNNYKNVGTFAAPAKNGRYTAYGYHYAENYDMYDSEEMTSFKSSKMSVVGCFKPKSGIDGSTAYTIVNASEILSNTSSDITFSFNVPNTVTSYRKGVKTVLTPDENGEYAMTLDCGEGFVMEAVEIDLPDTFTIDDALNAFKYVAGVDGLDYVSKFRYDLNSDKELTISESLILFKTVAGIA